MAEPSVCTIIAAYNAAGTIGAAIRSALAEPEVAEVVVVDDASTDQTAHAALAADDGSGRLKLLRLARNMGPAHARNQAIAASSAPYISILDADDRFLPGRFAPLFAQKDWDMAADNILQIPAARIAEALALPLPELVPEPEVFTLSRFLEGNITKGGMFRNETGFLKPVIRRDFLAQSGLLYHEDLRLGEDFILYARLMARGARFLVIRSCGYLAIERANSLSVLHRGVDLRKFAAASRAILAEETLTPAERRALARQERLTRAKYQHREFLDRKQKQGRAAAAGFILESPARLWPVGRGILRDKWRLLCRKIGLFQSSPPLRRLLLGPRL